jgi:hypothetical protein
LIIKTNNVSVTSTKQIVLDTTETTKVQIKYTVDTSDDTIINLEAILHNTTKIIESNLVGAVANEIVWSVTPTSATFIGSNIGGEVKLKIMANQSYTVTADVKNGSDSIISGSASIEASWIIPTSLTYSCPGGSTDNRTYQASGVSGITMQQSGTGSNCTMLFTCPSGTHFASQSSSIELTTNSAISGSQISPKWDSYSGQIKMLSYRTNKNSAYRDRNDVGWGNDVDYYESSYSVGDLGYKETAAACVPD